MPDDLSRPMTPALGPNSRIAVVGSGIAGLMSTYLLSRTHEVVLFEKDPRPGGHAHTVTVDLIDGPCAVDTGFIVYNDVNYPQLCALFDHLDVATAPSDMSFAVSLNGGSLEYSGSGLGGLFAQKRNYASAQHWRLVADLVRFYKRAPTLRTDPATDGMTLSDLMTYCGMSDHFTHAHILPMAAAIWSTPAQSIMDFPARSFLNFFDNHGLFRLKDRIAWRTVEGGSKQYVDTLLAATSAQVRLAAPVTQICRGKDGVWITTPRSEPEHFDAVVLACHGDQTLALLQDADAQERQALGAFRYETNRAYLHKDIHLMPRARRAWSSWNYLSSASRCVAPPAGRADRPGRDRGLAQSSTSLSASASDGPKLALSYWMNRLQPLKTQENLFVTLNPASEPAHSLGRYDYDHPIFDAAAVQAQKVVMTLQGHNHTFYAGAHLGYGFHEDGAQSAIAVARLLGAPAPWDKLAAPQPLTRIAA